MLSSRIQVRAKLPRLWAIGISRLNDEFSALVGDIGQRADLHIVSLGFDDALRAIAAAGEARPDVIVAGGATAAYLKSRTTIPVVVIAPSGFDVMNALAQARRQASPVALVTHGDTPHEIRQFAGAFDVDIVFGSYRTAEDAKKCVIDLQACGVGAIVGPGLITDLASQAGMVAVFLYSPASVRAAFDVALEVAQAMQREAVRRQRLDNLLQHMRDGVVALDAQGRVEAINRRLATVLGIDAASAVGHSLRELVPDIVAELPSANGDALGMVRGISYVIHRGPLASPDEGVGTVLTFQESRAVERLDRTLRSTQRSKQFTARYRLQDLVGDSDAIQHIRALIKRYARSNATLLVRGESGTGKEMVAQSVHQLSPRREFAFVALNCGAFPESLLESELFGYEDGAFSGARKGGKPGMIEVAHRGTLFLDEIAEMPLPLQSRLLRVLQEREVVRLGSTEPTRVDIRVIAATHHSLLDAITTGKFRADLYYRLNILNIKIPPLRERLTDLTSIAAQLLLQAARREPPLRARISSAGLAAKALDNIADTLSGYSWPGNVRELQNVIERIAVELADSDDSDVRPMTQSELLTIAPELFDARANNDGTETTMRERSRQKEVDEIHAALLAHQGDRAAASRALGISTTTMWRRLSRRVARS